MLCWIRHFQSEAQSSNWSLSKVNCRSDTYVSTGIGLASNSAARSVISHVGALPHYSTVLIASLPPETSSSASQRKPNPRRSPRTLLLLLLVIFSTARAALLVRVALWHERNLARQRGTIKG